MGGSQYRLYITYIREYENTDSNQNQLTYTTTKLREIKVVVENLFDFFLYYFIFFSIYIQ